MNSPANAGVSDRQSETTKPANRQHNHDDRQLDAAVIMRESDMYDKVLMEGMIQQTLAKAKHLEGVEELAEAGINVMDHPSAYGGIEKRTGDSKQVLIERGGVLYVYSMGTAAKADLADSDNAFVQSLVELIERYRPAEVWTSAFSRLIRAAEHAGDLLRVMTEHVDVLHAETDIRPSTPEGKMLFQVLTMIASAERDYILRRHTAGRVAQWRRQAWILSAYPPGYRLDEQRRLVIDPAQVPAVRKMLAIMGDTSLTPKQVASRLGELGISRPKMRKGHGAHATIADVRNPSEAVASIAGWVDLYRTGEYEVVWPNPFAGVEEFAGLRVEPAEPRDDYPNGALRLAQRVPIPEGGWADQKILDAVAERRRSPAAVGGSAHRTTPPLSGMFQFQDGTQEYALMSGRTRNTYVLLRRPHNPNRKHQGWHAQNGGDAELVARIGREELHSSIVSEVVKAVEHGVPGRLDTTRLLQGGSWLLPTGNRVRIRALKRKIKDQEAKLHRSKRNADNADDDEVAAMFVKDAVAHNKELRRLRRELAEAEQTDTPPTLGTSFKTNAALAAEGLAALQQTCSGPAELRAALRTIISDETMTVTGSTVTWQLSVQLPHTEGVIVLGPISGTVKNRKRKVRARRQRETKIAELVSLGLDKPAARSLASCPHPDLEATIRAHLQHKPWPKGVDEDWAKYVTAIYTSPQISWNPGRWRLPDQLRTRVLAALADAGGSLTVQHLVDRGFTAEQLRYLTRNLPTPTGQPILRITGRGTERTIHLIDCPHCRGTASLSCLTPETKPGVLCPGCMRLPTENSPVFPDWYRQDTASER